tara:strand:+ start:6511 stop:6681 length:171 start_codon:yes stop_codon:yes gene_type:complete
MNEIMIILFGLATIRTITPLKDGENWDIPHLLLAGSTSWAFYHLIANCATISFNGL